MKSEKLAKLSIADKKILEEMTSLHENQAEIIAMAIVGSVTREVAHYNDIDILILHENSSNFSIPQEILSVIESMGAYKLDDALRIALSYKKELSLVYKSSDLFFTRIDDILAGNEIERITKTWSIGGYISETLLADINNAIILFDKTSKLQTIIEKLSSYPNKFKQLIVKFLLEEIELKTPSLSSENVLVQRQAYADIQISSIRLLFALNNQLFPGIKRINDSTKFNNEYQQLLDLLASESQTNIRKGSKVIAKLASNN